MSAATSSLLRRVAPGYLAVGSLVTASAAKARSSSPAHAKAASQASFASAAAALASSTASSGGATSVRVASYNVLSDSLCRASHYCHSSPSDLENTARLARVKARIQEEMDRGAVICLQEVSRAWGGELVPFFEANGYAYAGGPYGNPFNGYMGVCVAWPRDKHSCLEVVVERVADTVGWAKEEPWLCPACSASCFPDRTKCFKCGAPKPGAAVEAAVASAAVVAPSPAVLPVAAAQAQATSPAVPGLGVAGGLVGLWATLASLRSGYNPSDTDISDRDIAPSDARAKVLTAAGAAAGVAFMAPRREFPFLVWEEVSKRGNCVVQVRLQDKASGRAFVVATYHMPCLFGSDEKCQVMTAHMALLMQACQRFASKQGACPLIVAGDFNMQPGTPPYKLATTGSLDPAHPQHPPAVTAIAGPKVAGWTVGFDAMKSAYAEAGGGSEPAFTNFAWSEFDKEGPFQETLDYIFVSSDVAVEGVRPLPEGKEGTRLACPGGFPTAAEPSDHVLIAADLIF